MEFAVIFFMPLRNPASERIIKRQMYRAWCERQLRATKNRKRGTVGVHPKKQLEETRNSFETKKKSSFGAISTKKNKA